MMTHKTDCTLLSIEYDRLKGEINQAYLNLKIVTALAINVLEQPDGNPTPSLINKLVLALDDLKLQRANLVFFGRQLVRNYFSTPEWTKGYPSPADVVNSIATFQLPRCIDPVIDRNETLVTKCYESQQDSREETVSAPRLRFLI